jgi:hypothetical protein
MIAVAKTDVWSHWVTLSHFELSLARFLRREIWPNQLSKLLSLDHPNHSFQAYAVSIEEMNSRSVGRCSGLIWKEATEMTLMTHKPVRKLHRAPQPPLSYPGAVPDSDRARRPPLAGPPATDQELNPGDRAEGLTTSESRPENSAQSSERTRRMLRSSDGMLTVV